MRGKDALKVLSKNFGVEALEEAVQEGLNQSIMKSNVPFYEFDRENIWKAAYAVGVFGLGMGGATTAVSHFVGGRAYKDLLSGARVSLDELQKSRKEGQDLTPYDKRIKAGLFLKMTPAAFSDDVAMGEGTQEDKDNFTKNSAVVELRSGDLATTKPKWWRPAQSRLLIIPPLPSGKHSSVRFIIPSERLIALPTGLSASPPRSISNTDS